MARLLDSIFRLLAELFTRGRITYPAERIKVAGYRVFARAWSSTVRYICAFPESSLPADPPSTMAVSTRKEIAEVLSRRHDELVDGRFVVPLQSALNLGATVSGVICPGGADARAILVRASPTDLPAADTLTAPLLRQSRRSDVAPQSAKMRGSRRRMARALS